MSLLRPRALPDLTPRQLELARLIARDWTIREAAERMGISYVTARIMLYHIYRRLGFSRGAGQARLVAWIRAKESANSNNVRGPKQKR